MAIVYRPSKNKVTGGYTDEHPGYDFSGRGDPHCYADLDLVVVHSVDRYKNAWINEGKLTTRDYGNYIKCRHNDGSFGLYAHLTPDQVPKVGQRFKKGQVLAVIGNTGNSTGPHLHYEYRNKSDKNQPVEFETAEEVMPDQQEKIDQLEKELKREKLRTQSAREDRGRLYVSLGVSQEIEQDPGIEAGLSAIRSMKERNFGLANALRDCQRELLLEKDPNIGQKDKKGSGVMGMINFSPQTPRLNKLAKSGMIVVISLVVLFGLQTLFPEVDLVQPRSTILALAMAWLVNLGKEATGN